MDHNPGGGVGSHPSSAGSRVVEAEIRPSAASQGAASQEGGVAFPPSPVAGRHMGHRMAAARRVAVGPTAAAPHRGAGQAVAVDPPQIPA